MKGLTKEQEEQMLEEGRERDYENKSPYCECVKCGVEIKKDNEVMWWNDEPYCLSCADDGDAKFDMMKDEQMLKGER